MRRPALGLPVWSSVLLVAGTSGCLFTDPINEAPTVTIEAPMSAIHKGDTVALRAAASDDGDVRRLRYVWRRGTVPCPASLAEADGSPTDGGPAWRVDEVRIQGEAYSTRVTGSDPFCVTVVVTDEHNARGFAAQAFEVANRAPVATLEVTRAAVVPAAEGATASVTAEDTFDLFTELRLSAEKSTDPDGDEVTEQWRLTDPAGQPVKPEDCRTPAPKVICFTPKVPGAYRIELRVHDDGKPKLQSAQPVVRTITVRPDRPPCIAGTAPEFSAPRLIREHTAVTSFSVVRVDDDVDVWPLDPTRGSNALPFAWSFRRGTNDKVEFTRLPAIRGSELSFPAGEFRPGDILQVRVEYRDRLAETPPRMQATDACRAAKTPRCESPAGSGCFQWVTWTVEYF